MVGTIVPRRWSGATVVCLASGPSLIPADVEATVALPTLAISDTFRLAPHAGVLYAPDTVWWRWHPEAAQHPAPLKYGLHHGLKDHPDVQQLQFSHGPGLSHGGMTLKGSHAGIQAINLALLLGATQILLLGYDMQPAPDGRQHFFGSHPNGSHVQYARRLADYDGIAEDLRKAGVTVLNASRRTAITTFPRMTLNDALKAA